MTLLQFLPVINKETLMFKKKIKINSLVLSLLYSLTLTSIHDYWKNHSFD